MKKLFNSLEALTDIQIEDVTLLEGDMERLQLEILETEFDIRKGLENIESIFDQLEDAVHAAERLENLSNVISEHGICRSLMEAVDPYGELVNAGFCVAYEELSDTPDRGEIATKAVEGIGDAIAAMFKGLVTFYVRYYEATVEYYGNIGRAFKSYNTALSGASKEVKGIIDIDDTKFKASSIKAYDKDDFKDVISAANKIIKFVNAGILVKALDSFEKMVDSDTIDLDKSKALAKQIGDQFKQFAGDHATVAGLGLTIKSDEDGFVTVSKSKPSLVFSKDTAGNLGWSGKDAATAVSEALRLISTTDILLSKLKTTADLVKRYAEIVKKKSKKSGDFDASQKAAFNYSSNKIKQLLNISRTIITATESASRNVCKSALTIVAAAKRSPKK